MYIIIISLATYVYVYVSKSLVLCIYSSPPCNYNGSNLNVIDFRFYSRIKKKKMKMIGFRLISTYHFRLTQVIDPL